MPLPYRFFDGSQKKEFEEAAFSKLRTYYVSSHLVGTISLTSCGVL